MLIFNFGKEERKNISFIKRKGKDRREKKLFPYARELRRKEKLNINPEM